MIQQAPVTVAPPIQENRSPELVDETAATTTAKTTKPRAKLEYQFQTFIRQLRSLAKVVEQRVLVLAQPSGNWSAARLGTAAGVVVLLLALGYGAFHFAGVFKKRMDTTVALAKVTTIPASVAITTDPPDSTVTSEGHSVANSTVPIGATIEVSHLGYKTRQVQIKGDHEARVPLEAEPLHLSVHTSASEGSAELDGQKIADLTDGTMEYALAADGAEHKLTISANGKRVLSLNVRASAGQPPQISGVEGSDLLAVASLGKHATLYGGSSLGNASIGDQRVAINPAGAAITLSDESHDVLFGRGDDQGSVSVDISNAPVLIVQSLSGDGRVVLTTNVDTALLRIDGSPLRGQNRRWTLSKAAPGSHKFTLSAEGYEPHSWTMRIPRRGVVNKSVILHPAVTVEPAMAGLSITGGTPGAEVAVDGKRAGKLDSSGNLNIPNIVTLGKHTVGMSKSGFEARAFEVAIRPGDPGKPLADAQISKAALSSSLGTLAFETTVKAAVVKYRRVDDAQFKDANPSDKIQLPPGQYEIVAEAAGYQRFTTTVNLGKEEVTLPLNLTEIRDYEFEDPNQIAHEGEWLKSKQSGKYINLKVGLLHVDLVFSRPGKTLFWDKKVEWMVEIPVHHINVQYSLEGQSGKLTRKLVVGQNSSNQREAKVEAESAERKDSFSLHIRVEGGQVRVTNDKGTVLDEFSVPGQDFSSGRIALRSGSFFLVRSDH